MRNSLICVPGICNWPGDHKNWYGRAVTYANVNLPDWWAQEMAYLALPLTRGIFHRSRVRRLTRMLSFYHCPKFTNHIAAHSNGCHIVVDALRRNGPVVDVVHLFNAACEAHFSKNGLNAALISGRVGKVRVYIGDRDKALLLASSWVGRLAGYGILGRSGPLAVNPTVSDRVEVIRWLDYGHSTAWSPAKFGSTMRLILDP